MASSLSAFSAPPIYAVTEKCRDDSVTHFPSFDPSRTESRISGSMSVSKVT